MDNVLIFTSKANRRHHENLQDFIEFCGKLPRLNDEYDPESNHWKGLGNFTVFGASNQDRIPENVLDASLLPFAKAYITYDNGRMSARDIKFKALRSINNACVKNHGRGSVDITQLTVNDLDLAAQVARESLSAGAAYQAGRGIKNLLKFLINNSMSSATTWKNPLRKPSDQGVGDDADAARQAKMPDENALMALAEISSKHTDELSKRDILVSSTLTLLFSAPSRGSEPFFLHSDCLHSEKMKASRALELGMGRDDIDQLIELNKKKKLSKTIINSGTVEPESKSEAFDWDETITLVGIRWYSGKGYGHECKWLPTVMIPSVKIAVERLIDQSADARAFAKRLEDSPYFPRHKLCPNVPEDQLLTADEAVLALGFEVTDNKTKSSRNHFLISRGVSIDDFSVSLQDLNQVIRSRLPKGFPHIPFKKGNDVKVKWSDSLYAGFVNALFDKTASRIKTVICTELAISTINTLNEDLASTKKRNKKTGVFGNTKSIFQRHGFGNLSLTSHQLRHLLDTMAAINGMSGDLRAKWAMRSDPAHNRYYDHTTPEEYGADFIEERERELVIQNEESTTQIQLLIATPRTIQELNTKANLTAHATDFGVCLTSYLNESCTRYRDCINCNEHACIKGDDGKCDRLRNRLKTESKLLKKDEKALNDGIQGAEQWFRRRKLTTERYSVLIAMMDDPSIPDGSIIKLANVESVSLLDRAMDANGKKRLPEIKNYQRIKDQLKAISVNEMIGIESNEQASPVIDESELDNLDDDPLEFFDEDAEWLSI